jgi:hypothetical protein
MAARLLNGMPVNSRISKYKTVDFYYAKVGQTASFVY